MKAPSLPEKVLGIDGALSAGKIAHAFGGALALAYYVEPRATIDVDVNVFVSPSDADRVQAALESLGVQPHPDRAALERDGQARWRWDKTPVELFLDNDPIHSAMRRAIRLVPFGEERIPILAPEHLLLCKVAFDRPRDWIDIEQMLLLSPDLDGQEIDLWLDRTLPAKDPRRKRIAAFIAKYRG